MRFRNNTVLFNVLFWLVYFLYTWLGNATIFNEYERYLITALVLLPITFGSAWLMVDVLLKKYYFSNRKQLFWIAAVASIIVFTLLRRAFSYYYIYPLYYPEGKAMSFLFLPKLVIEAVSNYLIVGLYALFYFIRAWYEQQRLSQMLQHDKLQSELELLKSQVHPHFIFNTLNNIYCLSLQNNPATPDLIYRLSSLLDYGLYNSNQESISVLKELEYIKNYIELERVRFGNKLDVSVNVYHPIEEFAISPMLLLPIVENCFKHGVSSDTDSSWIRMDVSVNKGWLVIKSENSFTSEPYRGHGAKKGIGLINVKRRLEILYPNKHEFSTLREKNSYLVILKIKVA